MDGTIRLPANEDERLLELNRTGVLDRPRDEDIDDILEMVREVLETDSCLFSIITENDQIEKFYAGRSIGNVPRSQSFCQYTVNSNTLFVVEDTFKDKRFNSLPMVKNGNGIRFYAGVPILALHDLPIGALCVVDSRKRDRLSETHAQVLNRAARLLRRRLVPEFSASLTSKLPVNVHGADSFLKACTDVFNKGRRTGGRPMAFFYCNDNRLANIEVSRQTSLLQEVESMLVERAGSISRQKLQIIAGVIDRGQFGFAFNANFDTETVEEMGVRIHAILNAPVMTSQGSINPKVSICVHVDDGTIGSIDEVMDFCRSVLSYKKLHEPGVVILTRAMIDQSNKLTAGRSAIKDAITQRKLSVVYQPIMTAEDGSLNGFEALVRWHHPVMGEFGAMEILELCAAEGLQADLDYTVIEMSCRAARLREDRCNDRARISVNVDTNTLGDETFARNIKRIVAKTGIDAALLELEITEHTVVRNHGAALAQMQALIDIGVTFVLDDFGTGYSSLTHLQQLPLTKLKIDRSFVENMGDDKTLTLVKALLSTARAMGLETTGEGVSTVAHKKRLKALGCTYLQGYLFDRPMVEEQFMTYRGSTDDSLATES
ncbi:MAG: EAL domain-containing protein [Alphaproteobacteria bacterium]